MIPVNFARLVSQARMPKYASIGAACFDLFAANGGWIGPGEALVAHIGIVVEVPEGHVMEIFSRSGHGFKHGIRLSNCTGVIDSDYRGPIMARLHNDGPEPWSFEIGDRIAQAMIRPVARVRFCEVPEEHLSVTERGAGGMGSTGK